VRSVCVLLAPCPQALPTRYLCLTLCMPRVARLPATRALRATMMRSVCGADSLLSFAPQMPAHIFQRDTAHAIGSVAQCIPAQCCAGIGLQVLALTLLALRLHAQMVGVARGLNLSIGDIVAVNLVYQLEHIGINCSNWNNTGPTGQCTGDADGLWFPPASTGAADGPAGWCTSVVAEDNDGKIVSFAASMFVCL